MANELKVLEGMDVIALARKHSDQAKVSGQVIPWQTSLSFDLSVDSDSTVTKDGNVATRSSASTDLEVEFLNNTAAIADVMYDSLFDGELLDFWILYRKRKNSAGKYYAWYMQVTVQEDSSDNDPDDHSTRDVTFSVNGTPKRGWTTLDDETQEQVDYVFLGVGKVTDTDKTGGGTVWNKTTDPGTNTADTAPAQGGSGTSPAQGGSGTGA
nr:MAG: tail tube protein [Bacteriophage sp.]